MKVSKHATEGSLLLVGCNFHQFPKLSRNYETEMHEREGYFASMRIWGLQVSDRLGKVRKRKHFGASSLRACIALSLRAQASTSAFGWSMLRFPTSPWQVQMSMRKSLWMARTHPSRQTEIWVSNHCVFIIPLLARRTTPPALEMEKDRTRFSIHYFFKILDF